MQQQGIAQIVQTTPDSESWTPVVGDETNEVISTLGIQDEADRTNLCNDAVEIMRRCVPPRSSPGSLTGLAVGHIQSGKTSSFTVVTALARDNRYPMVIVVGGTTLPLFRQSVNRLNHDLRLLDRRDRAWMPIQNPRGAQDADRIRGPLQDWRDGEDSQTVLLMVMKNHRHLRNLSDLLGSLDLHDIPVVIIDDEADQASLNNLAPRQQQSTTYRTFLDVRSRLPIHTFLQYTATPQAPLLISLIDRLSPEFARVLEPGHAYTGGRTFFVDRPGLIRRIPQSELPIPGNNLTGPPDSLLDALRLYFVGIAAEYARTGGRQPDGNRSMLIHPSMGVLPHQQFGGWVNETRNLWAQYLRASTTDPDRQELEDDMKTAYDDLHATGADLPPFQDVMRWMERAIDRTLVTVMNAAQARGTPDLNWNDRYAHILIGGEVLNRGFTVEGLTITYMPRSIGVGNVDTVQQRARFFGYKSSYIGFCRIFLEAGVDALFRRYVDHEESLRAELVRHGDRPLRDWKRAFLLDQQYTPTRRSVLGLDIFQRDFAGDWTTPDAPHRNGEAVAENLRTLQTVIAQLQWQPDQGDPRRTTEQIHLTARVPAIDALTHLLAPLRLVDAFDSVRFTGLLLQLRTYLESHDGESAVLFQMSGGRERRRALKANRDEIDYLFQGANAPTGYPGDRQIRDENLLTVQIHMLRIPNVPTAVPTVAVWLPRSMALGGVLVGRQL